MRESNGFVGVRLPTDLKAAAWRKARESGLKLSEFVRQLLQAAVDGPLADDADHAGDDMPKICPVRSSRGSRAGAKCDNLGGHGGKCDNGETP
jgi:hypothetical protein